MDAGSSPSARKSRGWPKEMMGIGESGYRHKMTPRTRFREASPGSVEAAV